jgi:cell division protein ZapA (FtsZ GTPase activity inhibitor)
MKLNNLLFVLLAVLMMHCNQKGKHPMQGASPEEIREQLLESSKSNAQQEDQQIERFIDANKLE